MASNEAKLEKEAEERERNSPLHDLRSKQNAAQLEFVSDIACTPRSDILLCAGVMQYMGEPIPLLLEKLPALPAHILLNKLPLTRSQGYWTLQNFGTAVSPYRVFNEKEFFDYFEKGGYALRDRWVVPELSCDVPFHPEYFVPHFTGLYFEKA